MWKCVCDFVHACAHVNVYVCMRVCVYVCVRIIRVCVCACMLVY